MDKHSSVEHICISSESEENGAQERVKHFHFDQQSRLHRSKTRFTVFNDHYMTVKTSGPGNSTSRYEFDLSFLASQPRHVRKIDRLSCALAMTVLFSAIATALLAKMETTALSLALIGTGLALSLGLVIYRWQDKLVFVTKHGRFPLLVLSNAVPTSEKFQAFVSELSQRIQSTRKNWSSKGEYLSAELRQHRRLQEMGIVTKKEYEVIKQRILGKHL